MLKKTNPPMLMTELTVGAGVWTGVGAGVSATAAGAGAGVDLTVLVGFLAARFLTTAVLAARLVFLVAASADPAVAGTTATARASAARPVRSGVVTLRISAAQRRF